MCCLKPNPLCNIMVWQLNEIIKSLLRTYLRFRYRNSELSSKATSATRTRNMHRSSLFWYWHTSHSRSLTGLNDSRLYEWLRPRRLSGVHQKAKLDRECRSDPKVHICPPFDLRQLLGNDTNLVPGPNHRIYNCCWSLSVLERGLLHSGLCNCYTHPL